MQEEPTTCNPCNECKAKEQSKGAVAFVLGNAVSLITLGVISEDDFVDQLGIMLQEYKAGLQ